MSIQKVFKSRLTNSTYLFKNGKAAVFSEGRFLTGVPVEIQELMGEIGEIGQFHSNHPSIYVDENEVELDTTLQDAIKEAQAAATLDVLKRFATPTPTPATPTPLNPIPNQTPAQFQASIGNSSSMLASLSSAPSNSASTVDSTSK